MNDNKDKKQFTIKIPESVEAGAYVNAISVHFNPNECIIDMGYSLPNSETPTIKVLSRVNMTHKTAESFINVLTNAMLDWKNKENKK